MITLQFVPYEELIDLDSSTRVKKLLKIAKENKIVLLEGRLKKEEEADLIKRTMEEIDDKFKGIELAVIYPNKKKADDLLLRWRNTLANALLGDRKGLTVIGPATVVKEIKRDPNKIQLLMFEKTRKSGFTRRKSRKRKR